MAFMGMTPFGNLLAGALASHIGTPLTIVCCIVSSHLGALAFATRLRALHSAIRPIYVEHGILPSIASGLGRATTIHEENAQ